MKVFKKIKQLFKSSNVTVSSDFNEKVLFDAENKLTESEATPSVSIWRTIMRSPITKTAAAAVIIIAVILGLTIIRGPSNSGRVFAGVVQQIRKARTVTFTTEIQVGQQTMRIENAQKEPGLKRAVMPGGLVVINDILQKKGILIDHSKKQYTEKDLENATADQTYDFFEHMRTLPDRANEVLAKKQMDSRMVQGFHVIEHGIDATCWVDVQTGDLVRVEGQLPNAPKTHIVASNFKFDVELDDALFSLTPPDGYTPTESPKVDRSEVNCQDLINLLRWWATNVEGGLFPPSLEPAEFAKVGSEMKKGGKVSALEGTEDEKLQQATKLSRGITFVIMMRLENDWHYVGKGVKLGDAESPVCWYRPVGSETYRVIYGDLSVKDVNEEDLPN